MVPQPFWSVALQVRSSNTVTLPVEPAPASATYTVCVAGSIATAPGLAPTVTVGGVALQPDAWKALHSLVSIIATAVELVGT